MDYQFIIISATEARKVKTLQLLQKVNDKNKPIHILEASVPENSQDYIVGYEHLTQNQKGEICCCRSHMRAIEYASLDSSPDYSVILEDDTTFVKSGFSDMIEELIREWNESYEKIHYIHIINIGWIPTVNYKQHIDKYEFNPNVVLSSGHQLQRLGVTGLQGYIICKKHLKDKMHILQSPTYSAWKANILSFVPEYMKNTDVVPVDYILFKLFFCPSIVFPPIVIERFNEPSLLGHKNTEMFWKPFFKDYESEMDKYLWE